MKSIILSTSLLFTIVQAHFHGHHDHHDLLIRRGATKTTTASTGSTTPLCPTPTAIPAVDAMVKEFPTVGKIATIVTGDTVAQGIWASIQANETYKAALAISAHQLDKSGNPVFTGYSTSDPDCWWTESTCTVPKATFLPPDVSTCQEPAVWGLSVDDGPLPAHCHLYDFYTQQNIKASLFWIGSNVLSYPASAYEGFQGGHHICVHTWSHQYTTTLTSEQVFAELYYTKLAIKRVVGYTPRCFRPPYGDVDDRVRTIAAALDMITVLWDQDTNDWNLPVVGQAVIQQNFNEIFGNVSQQHGMMVLDHELDENITGIWIDNYPQIKTTFSAVVAGLTCNNITSPWAETNAPTYPDYAGYMSGGQATGDLTPVTDATSQILLTLGSPMTGASSSSTPSTPSTPSDDSPVVVYVTPSAESENVTPTSVKGITGAGSTNRFNILFGLGLVFVLLL